MYKQLLFLGLLLILGTACNPSVSSDTTVNEAQYSFDVTAAIQDYQSIKKAVQAGQENRSLSQKLREEIGLRNFDQQEIEISEAQLWYDGQEIKAIDTDYFDGAPVGTKHWYCEHGVPVAVEVAAYELDEGGVVLEKHRYTLILDPKEEQDSLIDLQKELSSAQKIAIVAENRKEWQLLQSLADKYRPKKK